MPDRTRLTQSGPPGRLIVRLVLVLIWCATFLMVGSSGVVFQRLYQTYRLETADGRNSLAAAPYEADERGSTARERRVAIIIDDLGIDMGLARKFMELPIPVTLAILPYQPFSQRIASEAARCGKEVLLHLPMQPREYPTVNPGTGSLLVSMDRGRVQAEVATQIDSLPGCVGVSTHMGSLFTEKEKPMEWVLSVVGERHLFFVDSLTTPDSVARVVARGLGVSFARRTHFLDVERTEDAIIRQLCRLVDTAVRQGGAIGVAHPSAETLGALPKAVPAFAEKGVRIVPVSQMVSTFKGSGIRVQGSGAETLVPMPGRPHTETNDEG
jgi:polysaccharide deacetylase 2 family uncharacterized protein YibQ